MGGYGQLQHILDWWHISMRIQHVEAAVQGLLLIPGFTGILVLFQRPAKSLRWWLCHDRARVAVIYLKWFMHDCAGLTEEPLSVRTVAARMRASCKTHKDFPTCPPIVATVTSDSRFRQTRSGHSKFLLQAGAEDVRHHPVGLMAK